MGAVNKRGVWVPAAGDGLLAGWNTAASQLGVYMPVASTAAASAALTQAEAAGMGATVSHPIMFLIGTTPAKTLYAADGSKTNGKWNLSPINEVQVADDTYSTAWSGYKSFSVAGQATSGMMASSLPAAPYDRRVTAQAMAYGQRTAGSPMLRLTMHDGRESFARFDADPGTAGCPPLSCVIPANAAPSITVKLHGGSSAGGTNTVSLSGDERMSALMVTAYPILMAV